MVIDQSPASLARSVISNTGTKIVMRLEDGAEMEEIGRALGLEEDAWKKLGYLQEGEAIIKASFMDAPVKTARFNNTTSGPSEHERTKAGTVPRYAELGDLWSGVLTSARRPDEAKTKLGKKVMITTIASTGISSTMSIATTMPITDSTEPSASVIVSDLRATWSSGSWRRTACSMSDSATPEPVRVTSGLTIVKTDTYAP